jgi:hypothetical protein
MDRLNNWLEYQCSLRSYLSSPGISWTSWLHRPLSLPGISSNIGCALETFLRPSGSRIDMYLHHRHMSRMVFDTARTCRSPSFQTSRTSILRHTSNHQGRETRSRHYTKCTTVRCYCRRSCTLSYTACIGSSLHKCHPGSSDSTYSGTKSYRSLSRSHCSFCTPSRPRHMCSMGNHT